jgi:AAA domain
MKLHRLKLEQLRQFRQPFEIAGLEPGLNLFEGPNEAGKSTLVRAIRAAFFERHRSTSVDDLLPWGEPSATPSVELDFSIGAVDYRLRKSFMHRKRCELKGGAADLDGEDAEQHLAELLGFRFAGKGASKPEHWGIPGLLWIEQGSAQDITGSVSNATDYLRKALDQSISEVASTQGDEVIQRVRSEREALLTRTGRPSGTYAKIIADRDAVALRLTELDARIAQYRQQVDQLGQLRTESAADAVAKPWEAFRIQQQKAETCFVAVKAMKLQLDTDKASLMRLDDTHQLIADQLAAFDEQLRALRQRDADLTKAEALGQSTQSAAEAWGATLADAEGAYQRDTEVLAQSQHEDLRADFARRISDAQSRISALTDLIQSAAAEQTQLQAHRKIALASEINEAHIIRLRDQQAKLNELRIRQEAAATRIYFEINVAANVTLAGRQLSGTGEQLITAEAELHIPDVGRLKIIPGGADLNELARDEAEQRAAHQALLQRVGAATLAHAEARYASYQQATKDIKHGENILAKLAPKGIEGLRTELDEYAVRKTEAESQVAQLDPLSALPDRLAVPLPLATERQKTSGDHLEQMTRQAADARQVASTAKTQMESALRERDALKALIDSADRQQRERETGLRLLTVRAERDELKARISTKQEEVDTARPDILAQDVERFKLSADQAERAFSERQTRITLLQGKLEESGAQGLEEERADVWALSEAIERRHEELKLRAEALDLLLSLLEAKRRDLTKRLQAPLQKHVNRYLQLLFPQASLDIGEDLIPGSLTRNGLQGAETGPVGDLSFGAREQMGVISRLAYADLLKEAGRPTLIILDDALVHSDEHRLEQMKRVIFDTAQRHQVLLFTCHPTAWRGMGVAPRTISLLQAQ